MRYYYHSDNAFCDEKREDEECTKEYTDEEYAELFANTDSYHYIGLKEGETLPSVLEVPTETGDEWTRGKREKVCFPIINRGTFWYDMLTDEQREELREWYQAWLDVTDTHVEPKTPDWIE